LRLVLAGQLGLLLQLVPVLAVVHDTAHRWVGLRGDLDQVEVLRICVLPCLVRRLDPELLAVLVDQPHARNADGVVDPGLRLWTARRFERTPAPRPQMLFTKLVLSSFSHEKTAGMQRQEVSSTNSVEPPKRELGGERRL